GGRSAPGFSTCPTSSPTGPAGRRLQTAMTPSAAPPITTASSSTTVLERSLSRSARYASKCRVERSNSCKRDGSPSEGQAPALWTYPNRRSRATQLRVVRRDARNRVGNEHLIALGGFHFERQSCAKLCQISGAAKSNDGWQACDQHF